MPNIQHVLSLKRSWTRAWCQMVRWIRPRWPSFFSVPLSPSPVPIHTTSPNARRLVLVSPRRRPHQRVSDKTQLENYWSYFSTPTSSSPLSSCICLFMVRPSNALQHTYVNLHVPKSFFAYRLVTESSLDTGHTFPVFSEV